MFWDTHGRSCWVSSRSVDYAGEFRPLADGAIVTYFTFEAGYIIAAMPQRVIEFLRGISLFG